jgi:hypothetical protein
MGPLGAIPGSVARMILALALIFGGPVLHVHLQVRAIWRRSGAWRPAALPPRLLMGGAAACTARRLAEGSNLAPVIVIFMLPVALPWLVVAGAIRNRALG